MKGPANLLVDEISDFTSVSRTGKIYDKYVFSHIYHLSMMFNLNQKLPSSSRARCIVAMLSCGKELLNLRKKNEQVGRSKRRQPSNS